MSAGLVSLTLCCMPKSAVISQSGFFFNPLTKALLDKNAKLRSLDWEYVSPDTVMAGF